MWPCFQDGDLLQLREVDFKEIKVGDCIVYKTDSRQQAVHRVTGKTDRLFTRGDAMPVPDRDLIEAHRVVGRVVARHRFGCETSVSGGLAGRLAGFFYRYAGRIDPQRESRGGQLARCIQKFSASGLALTRFKGETRKLVRKNEEDILVWMLGNRVIGIQKKRQHNWSPAWPWSLLTRSRKDSD